MFFNQEIKLCYNQSIDGVYASLCIEFKDHKRSRMKESAGLSTDALRKSIFFPVIPDRDDQE